MRSRQARHLRGPGPGGVEDEARPQCLLLPCPQIAQDHALDASPLHQKIDHFRIGADVCAVLSRRDGDGGAESKGVEPPFVEAYRGDEIRLKRKLEGVGWSPRKVRTRL